MSRLDSISSQQIERLLEISRLLAITSELDLILTHIAEAATTILSCERASIFLYDAITHQLCTKVALKSDEIRVPAQSGIVGYAFTFNQVVDVPNAYGDSRFNPEIDRRAGFVTRNLLAAPMVDINNRPLGVLQALNKHFGAFTRDDQSLIQLLADQAGVAIQRYRWQETAMENVALRREMELARKVQLGLIPKSPPEIPGLVAAGRMLPASITGGDCFDLWKTPDGQMGILLADACGHGLAPALVVSQTRTLVRSLSDMELNPSSLLTRINNRLSGDLEPGNFVTAFLGFLSPDGILTWSSAGHSPVMIRESGGQVIRTFNPEFPPLGVSPGLSNPPVFTTHISRGGMLAVASDGITEAHDHGQELFGLARLTQLLEEGAGQQPPQIIHNVFDSVSRWKQRPNPMDDQTMVVVMPWSS